MYDTIKNITEKYYGCVTVILAIICAIICIVGILCYTNRDSNNIDTSRIQNAQQELVTVRQEQKRVIEQNKNARESITNSIDLNERASKAITSSEEYNRRTEQAITTSKSELREAARIVSDNAKLISESRSILERAKERTGASEQRT